MFTKYILCILTIEWAVIGTWLLKGKGRSYERIQRNDEIREKDRRKLDQLLVENAGKNSA